MRCKEFLHAVANGQTDILQIFLDILAEMVSPYCVIGGLAVNAYVEPVVSLDVDIAVAAKDVGAVRDAAQKRQKDLADILRIIEAYPQFGEKLPPSLAAELDRKLSPPARRGFPARKRFLSRSCPSTPSTRRILRGTFG